MPRPPPRLRPEEYEPDEDGLPRAIVGAWVKEKHLRLQHYVGATRAARRNYIGPGNAGATYIDLFCGPARARIEQTTEVIDGSPLVAWRQSFADGVPFTSVHIADAHPQLVEATCIRLKSADASVHEDVGKAASVVDRVIARLDPYGLHFAFLDPYGLKDLPFEVLRRLASLKRMDMLIHVSVLGLQRNLKPFARSRACALDSFAPGWRSAVDPRHIDANARARVLAHWRDLLRSLGVEVADAIELVRADDNQPLYWLAFAARHPLAIQIWERISQIDRQGRFGF
ncbi:MAG: three-Cys-motif partner protein TcmP [Burkholderiales bacterium]|nr:three-Cys-motif partner protein TcmP [Burkholderiales bacterium]